MEDFKKTIDTIINMSFDCGSAGYSIEETINHIYSKLMVNNKKFYSDKEIKLGLDFYLIFANDFFEYLNNLKNE